jgi:predicted RNase H-like nuclease (RuvC/YqgF family)
MIEGHTLVDILLAVGGFGGVAALIYALIARRKAPAEIKVIEKTAKKADAEADKADAEASEIVTRAMKQLQESLGKQICDLQAENRLLRFELTEMRAVQAKHEGEIAHLNAMCEQFDEVLTGAHVLFGQVVELNGVPKWKPPERRK